MHSSVHSSLFTISNTWKQLKCPSTEERIKKIYLSIHVHIVVQLLSPVWLLWPCELQHTRLPCPSLSPWVGSNSFPVMPSSHLILCRPLHLLPSIFLSIKIFSNESVFCIRWPKYWSFSISLSNEYSGLISFRMDWFHFLAVQGTPNSLLQHHSSKASILWCSAFFVVQLSHC